MKLTAERCKRLINQLSFERDNGGMSNQKFDYLDALEIALPILEREQGEGWIEWGGGERPVAKVEVKYRNGQLRNENAGCLRWYHLQNDFDIIAYRIIPERATNQNGEQ